ncbi:MAG: hypothetical protein U1F21_03475 [Sphaerotilus natans]
MLIHALPIFHVHGLFVASRALLNGSKMLWLAKFDLEGGGRAPAARDRLKARRCTCDCCRRPG